MTVAEVKTYLGITDTSYDAGIAIYLPAVTDDLTRKNGICNQSFMFEQRCDTDSTAVLSNVTLTAKEWDCLYIGATVLINAEDHTILTYDETARTITLDSAVSITADNQKLYIRNFPIGAKPVVAQMILYKINEGSISGATFGKEVASKSIGILSVSFKGDSSNVTKDRFGYPSELTAGLRTIKRPRFH